MNQTSPLLRELLDRAVHAQRVGEFATAARLCREILAASPQHVGALLVLAETHEVQGQFADAMNLTDTAIALAPSSAFAWNKRGSILGKAGHLHDALTAFQRAAALSPANVDVAGNIGRTLRLLGRNEEALDVFDRLIGIGDPQVFVTRGEILKRLGRPDEAIASFRDGLSGAASDARLHAAIGGLEFELERFEEAVASYRAAAALEPDRSMHMSNLGLTLSELGRYDDAIDALNRALEIEPGNATARWNRALSLLVAGNFRDGLNDYEARFLVDGPTFERLRAYPVPHWAPGGDIKRKTILLYCGQGLGDTIQFFRFARRLVERGARVVVEVQGSLLALLKASNVDVAVFAQGEAPPPFDLYCPMASVPLRIDAQLGDIGSDVPYLIADPVKRAIWRSRLATLGSVKKVGLAWAGNPRHVRDRRRSLPLAKLALLLSLKDVAFVGLQKDLREGDAEILERCGNLLDVSAQLEDFSDTAALVSELDLVISIDSAVAHVAGALGRPLWVLLPFAPDWRWLLDRSDSPWYPTARLFRQPARGDWERVVRDISSALAEDDAGGIRVAGWS